ncbi:MAG: transglutaminase domain-containing protein, partial [Sedimentisphaerales bacterium]|nr:transglutaminase domain-containing protein [Sedimentisphaerales bacterium]
IDAVVAKLPLEYSQGVSDAFVNAGLNSSEILQVFERVSPAHMEAAAFLIAHMPKSDLRSLSSEFILNNINLTYKAASLTNWKGIPQDVFLNNVLPYANLDELRDDWRGMLMELVMPVVADCQTPIQAAQKINEQIWELTKVKYSTEREKPNQNPTESMASGIASCSGLSILLVDACRSVGIPARVAGIAKWPHKDGNHSWVEVWDGKWYTLGAWDGKGPDDVWFAPDAARAQKGSRASGIFAVSYAKTDVPFRCVWSNDESKVSAVEVTDRYLAMWQPQTDGNLTAFRVFSADGKRLEAQIKIDSEGQETQSGTSRGENRDTNDTASFKLMPGESYSIEVSYNGQIKAMSFIPENKAFQTVDIKID